MVLDLSPFDRAVSQLRTFYVLSTQPQDHAVMASSACICLPMSMYWSSVRVPVAGQAVF